MNIYERIKKARIEKGLTLEQVGKELGVTTQAVQKWESEIVQAIPRGNRLNNLAKLLGVTPEWLQFGIATAIPPASSIAIQENADTSCPYHEIPLYDYKLSVGKGNSCWIENKKELPPVFCKQWFKKHNLNPDDLRAMHVKGVSMQPELKDGDTVIINITDLEIVDGGIYAVVYKEKLYIRRIKHIEDGIALISANPEYDTMNVIPDTFDRFQLLGRMVWRGG